MNGSKKENSKETEWKYTKSVYKEETILTKYLNQEVKILLIGTSLNSNLRKFEIHTSDDCVFYVHYQKVVDKDIKDVLYLN